MEQKVFQEVFISAFEKKTEGEALKILEDIRNAHSEKNGWKEIRGFVEKLPNGKFRAVREHAIYK